MEARYATWIKARYGTYETALRKCREAVQAMCAEFPELRAQRGHVLLNDTLREPHWWAIAPDGNIVDPTLAQYRVGVAVYEPLVLDARGEPTGKCWNCGGLVYDRSGSCSEPCRAAWKVEEERIRGKYAKQHDDARGNGRRA